MSRCARLLAVAVLFVAGGVALVTGQADSQKFTACLTAGGALVSVALGDDPARPCSFGQTEVSWNQEGPPAPPAGGVPRLTLYNHLCNEVLLPGAAPVDVMTLVVPPGSWLAHISIQAGGLGPCGGGDPLEGLSLTGDYDCALIGGGAGGGGGHPASSRMTEFRTLAWSEPLSLEDETTVVVRCRLFDGSGDGATLSVGDLVITPIRGF